MLVVLEMNNISSGSLADEVHSLRLEPVAAVQVGEDEVLRCVLHARTRAQGALANRPFHVILLMIERAGVREGRRQVN